MKENLHIFYVPEAANATPGTLIYLSDDEAAHCSRVLRLKSSDFITVIDGKAKCIPLNSLIVIKIMFQR